MLKMKIYLATTLVSVLIHQSLFAQVTKDLSEVTGGSNNTGIATIQVNTVDETKKYAAFNEMQEFYNQEYTNLSKRIPELKSVSDFSEMLILQISEGQFGPWSFIKNAPALVNMFNDKLTAFMDAVQDVTPLEQMATDDRVRKYISDNIPLTEKSTEVLSRYIDTIHSPTLLQAFLAGPLKGPTIGNPTLALVLYNKLAGLIGKCDKQDCWNSIDDLGLMEQLVESKNQDGEWVVRHPELLHTYHAQLATIAKLALQSTDDFIDFMAKVDWKYIHRHPQLKETIASIISGKTHQEEQAKEFKTLETTFKEVRSTFEHDLADAIAEKETCKGEKATLTDKLSSFTADNEALHKDNVALGEKHAALKAESSGRIQTLLGSLDTAQKQVASADGKCNTEKADLQSKINGLHGQLGVNQAKATRLDRVIAYMNTPGTIMSSLNSLTSPITGGLSPQTLCSMGFALPASLATVAVMFAPALGGALFAFTSSIYMYDIYQTYNILMKS